MDLNQLLVRMRPLLSATLPKRAGVRWDLGAGLRTTDADATQLRQVAMNLLSNAADAVADREPVIELITRERDVSAAELAKGVIADPLPAGCYLSLTVRDNGVGLDPETRARLFEPFFTTKFTGRGLGLAVVLGIVRAHQGTIIVQSELGRGTSFEVLLPCAEEAPVSAAERVAEPAAAVGTDWHRGLLVLVVDDEPLVRDVTLAALRSAGVAALAVEGGPQAIELFKERASEFCAVLVDRTMPKMSGEEVCVHLREIRPGVPILMCSGYSANETFGLPAASRPSGFLPKPYTRGRLLAALQKIVLDADRR